MVGVYTANDDALRGIGSGHTRLIHALTVFYYVCYRREMKMDLWSTGTCYVLDESGHLAVGY